jgi:hypothetical protein
MKYTKIINTHIDSKNSIKLGKATLLQKTPHIGSDAYLHAFYDGLTDAEISELEKSIGREIPSELKAFYKEYNGLDLFSGSISIFGLRKNHARDVSATWQPYDLRTPNIDERPMDATSDMVFFGAYDWDGSYLFVRSDGTNIYRCERDSCKPINSWESVETFLSAETIRLNSLFDASGQQINPDQPTTPP